MLRDFEVTNQLECLLRCELFVMYIQLSFMIFRDKHLAVMENLKDFAWEKTIASRYFILKQNLRV